MAIKLTDTIQTSEGSTTGLYFNITEFFRWKNGINSQFAVQYYTDDTKTTKCKIFEGDLKYTYTVDISGSIGTDSIEKAAYDAIGAELKAAGLNPQSDESGSWVAY
jgi:hypothetical protein